MLAAAIFLVGIPLPKHGPGAHETITSASPLALAGTPVAALEILGRSAVQRMMEHLTQGGVTTFSILAGEGFVLNAPITTHPLQSVDVCSLNSSVDIWPAAQRTVHSLAANGVENIFLFGNGGYAEFDLEEILEFSSTANQGVVRVHDRQGPLDIRLIKARHFSGGLDLREHLQSPEAAAGSYVCNGYANRLSEIGDLRRFAVDIFHGRCVAAPKGREMRPGIWMDQGAQVHRHARIVPPAYFGKDVKVGATALITRSSNVERNSCVEYGTVVEDSSVLADTYIGAGLDVTHSVVYKNKLVHLRQEIELEINDGILIGANLVSPLRRTFRRDAKASTVPNGRHLQLAVSHQPTQGKGSL